VKKYFRLILLKINHKIIIRSFVNTAPRLLKLVFCS
jgi:hypothetical protein